MDVAGNDKTLYEQDRKVNGLMKQISSYTNITQVKLQKIRSFILIVGLCQNIDPLSESRSPSKRGTSKDHFAKLNCRSDLSSKGSIWERPIFEVIMTLLVAIGKS